MPTALFLGNSHLAALKLAFDALDTPGIPPCQFFAARGADLVYTELVDGMIVGRDWASFGDDEQEMSFADLSPKLREIYRDRGEPTRTLADQFRMTGGSETIDLSDVATIFYVVGVSPYDFKRLQKRGIDLEKAASIETVRTVLESKFLLRDLLKEIREWRSDIKHCFIGIPLRAVESDEAHVLLAGPVSEARRRIAEIVRNHRYFDHAFMPPEHLLMPSLLATRPEFIHAGRRETQDYLSAGQSPGVEDRAHLNRLYGAEVLREFVLPIIAPDITGIGKAPEENPIPRKRVRSRIAVPDKT